MLIDWFTVGAQALNFLVLVWLMKRFLYKPILLAIDTREQRIAAAVTDADAKKAAAEKEREDLARKNAEFDTERAALVGKARAEAEVERKQLIGAAHEAADAISAARAEALRSDARALREGLTRRTQEVVFQIARRALGDLATVSLEERLGEVFTRRLAELSSETREQLARALKATSEPAVVRSAFVLPAREQASVQSSLREALSADVAVRFEVTPKLISGIEVSCGGLKVGWSIGEYLTSLERDLAERFSAKAKDAPFPAEVPAPPLAQAAASKAQPETRGA